MANNNIPPNSPRRGRMVFINIHKKDPESFRTIKCSDYSFNGNNHRVNMVNRKEVK